VQLPVKPLRDDGELTTLGDAIELFGFEPAKVKAKIQGVVVPLDATIFGISSTLCHCDNWMYVTLIK
jgi:hypothetical protein